MALYRDDAIKALEKVLIQELTNFTSSHAQMSIEEKDLRDAYIREVYMTVCDLVTQPEDYIYEDHAFYFLPPSVEAVSLWNDIYPDFDISIPDE